MHIDIQSSAWQRAIVPGPIHPHLPYVPGHGAVRSGDTSLEMCMGMGKTGIPWVPWDSHGNGNKVSHGMGMGWEWELSAWEWELRRGNGKKTAHCKQQALAISACVSVFA